MTDQELKDLVASLAISQKEVHSDFLNLQSEVRKTEKVVKNLAKQMGELGKKWGTFTEGLSGPSIRKILMDKLGATNVVFNAVSNEGGENMELDALGTVNGDVQKAYVVEIKSHLRDEALDQLLKILEKFPKGFPAHKDKAVYGVIACMHAPDNLIKKLRNNGIYLAVASDDILRLQSFPSFKPMNFNPQS